jgi:hypothetical protein
VQPIGESVPVQRHAAPVGAGDIFETRERVGREGGQVGLTRLCREGGGDVGGGHNGRLQPLLEMR